LADFLADFSAASVAASGDKGTLDDFAEGVAAVAGSAGAAGIAVVPVDESAGVAGVAAVAGVAGVAAGDDAGGAAVPVDATTNASPPKSNAEVFIPYPSFDLLCRE
jgi:hypothetical protein